MASRCSWEGFTGVAVVFGATLNLSLMWPGSAGVNPAFLLALVVLVAVWRVAGQVGADHWLVDRLVPCARPGGGSRWGGSRYGTPDRRLQGRALR